MSVSCPRNKGSIKHQSSRWSPGRHAPRDHTGREVDDAAPAPIQHVEQSVVAGEERAVEVGSDGVRPGIGPRGGDRSNGLDGAGIVDQDVDPTCLVEETPHVVGPHQIGGKRPRLTPVGANLLRRRFELLLITGRNDNAGAAAGQSQSRRPPMPRLAPVTRAVLPCRSGSFMASP